MNTTSKSRKQHDLTRRTYYLVLEDGSVVDRAEMMAAVAENSNKRRECFSQSGRWQLVVQPAAVAVSTGHIGFSGSFEYFWAANGDLYRANKNNPLDTEGYRMGARFESTKHAADYLLKQAGLR